MPIKKTEVSTGSSAGSVFSQDLSSLNRITWRRLSDPQNHSLRQRGRLQTQKSAKPVAQFSLSSFFLILIKNQDLPAASRRCPVAAALSTASHGKTPAPRNNLGPCSSQTRAASCKRGTTGTLTQGTGATCLCPHDPQPWQAKLGYKRRAPGAVTTSRGNGFYKSVW